MSETMRWQVLSRQPAEYVIIESEIKLSIILALIAKKSAVS